MIHIISSLRNKDKGTLTGNKHFRPSENTIERWHIPKKIKAAMSSRCPSVVKILYGAE